MSLKENVEKFLYEEVDLLDRWKLAEWEALLTDDAHYLVPPIGTNDEDASPDTTLYVVAENRENIAARVERMLGKDAYAEQPRSNLRHLVSNVRILSQNGDNITAVANFCVYRVRRNQIVEYMGQYRYQLVTDGDTFKIREKKVFLDITAFAGQGGLSFIL
jgi:p-cumate 2,3-dioxygenase subunit beta